MNWGQTPIIVIVFSIIKQHLKGGFSLFLPLLILLCFFMHTHRGFFLKSILTQCFLWMWLWIMQRSVSRRNNDSRERMAVCSIWALTFPHNSCQLYNWARKRRWMTDLNEWQAHSKVIPIFLLEVTSDLKQAYKSICSWQFPELPPALRCTW